MRLDIIYNLEHPDDKNLLLLALLILLKELGSSIL